MRKFDAVIYAIAALFLLLLCFGGNSQADFLKSYNAVQSVTFHKGESTAHFICALKQKHIVSNAALLKFLLAASGTDKTLQAGSFKLKSGSAYEVWCQLKTAKAEYIAVTLIPGRTLQENAQANLLNLQKIMAALSDKNNFPAPLQNKLPFDTEARAAFLLPETYFFATESDLETLLVREAAKLWVKRIGEKTLHKADKEQLLKFAIVASLVEGEARVKEDRPLLAAIFFKRLARPMRLQSCATVIYCWKKERGIKKRQLTYEDLKIDSPFNTYIHDGLPPAPINMPSENSWKATVEKRDTDYLYFFADGTGKHIFSKTYAEHLQKQKELLK